MSRERTLCFLPKDERFVFLRDAVLPLEDQPAAAVDLTDVRSVRLVEWEETAEIAGQAHGVTFFRVDVRVQDGTPWLFGPRSTHEDGAFGAISLALALAQGLLPAILLAAAAVLAAADLAQTLAEKAAEERADVIGHVLTVASGAQAIGVSSVRLAPRASRRGPFAFLAGAARTVYQARADLFDIEAYCAEHGHFGAGGMAHVAAEKLSRSADDEELWILIRSCILTSRMFRPTSRFDFTSYMGAAHGAYCLIAWILWGVLRHRRARVLELRRLCTPLRAPEPAPIEHLREMFDADPEGVSRQLMEHGLKAGDIRLHHVQADGAKEA